jgi:hypothetical protein
MTTGNRGFTHLHLPWDDIGTSQNKGGLTLTIFSAETARHVLAGAFSALRALDPDGTVTVRTENEEIHTLAEILPGRAPAACVPAACGLDECDCHDAPEPDAVKQVRELLPKTTLHEPDPGPPPFAPDPPQPAPFTSPDLVIQPDAISAPVETGEPWRGPAQADWDESR